MFNCFIVILLLHQICSVLNLNFGSNVHMVETAIGTHDLIGENLFFEIIKPSSLSYTYKIRPAKDFGSNFNSTYLGSNMHLVPTDPPWSCIDIVNSKSIRGHIALVERGECSFVQKAMVSELAGAKAIIITDNDPDSDDYYIEMISDNSLRNINIPVAFLVGKNGKIIRNTLSRLKMDYAVINIPVNLTFVPLHKMKQPPWVRL